MLSPTSYHVRRVIFVRGIGPPRRHSSSSTPSYDPYCPEFKAAVIERLSKLRPMRFPAKRVTKEAAILIPFCVLEPSGETAFLFTRRSNQLRSHRGEISFPGGNRDETDPSVEAAALREMHEELGVDPADVNVWAELPSLPSRRGDTAVHPFLGFLPRVHSDTDVTPNPDEVEYVFLETAEYLISQPRLTTQFKEGRFVYVLPAFLSHCGGEKIWGMTGFILHQVLRAFDPERVSRLRIIPSVK